MLYPTELPGRNTFFNPRMIAFHGVLTSLAIPGEAFGRTRAVLALKTRPHPTELPGRKHFYFTSAVISHPWHARQPTHRVWAFGRTRTCSRGISGLT